MQIFRRLVRQLPLQLAGLGLRDVLFVGEIFEGQFRSRGEQFPQQNGERKDVTLDGEIVVLEALGSHPSNWHQLVLVFEVLFVVLVSAQARKGDLGREVTADYTVARGKVPVKEDFTINFNPNAIHSISQFKSDIFPFKPMALIAFNCSYL